MFMKIARGLWWLTIGQVWKGVSWGFSKDPMALYAVKVEHATQDLKEMESALEQSQLFIATSRRQIEDSEGKIDTCTRKAQQWVETNREKARSFAMMVSREKEQKLISEAALVKHEELYANQLERVKASTRVIEEASAAKIRLKADLDMSKACALNARMISSFQTNQPGASLGGLGEVKGEIQRQIDANMSTVKVISDLSGEGIEDLRLEESAREQEADMLLEGLTGKKLLPEGVQSVDAEIMNEGEEV